MARRGVAGSWAVPSVSTASLRSYSVAQGGVGRQGIEQSTFTGCSSLLEIRRASAYGRPVLRHGPELCCLKEKGCGGGFGCAPLHCSGALPREMFVCFVLTLVMFAFCKKCVLCLHAHVYPA